MKLPLRNLKDLFFEEFEVEETLLDLLGVAVDDKKITLAQMNSLLEAYQINNLDMDTEIGDVVNFPAIPDMIPEKDFKLIDKYADQNADKLLTYYDRIVDPMSYTLPEPKFYYGLKPEFALYAKEY